LRGVAKRAALGVAAVLVSPLALAAAAGLRCGGEGLFGAGASFLALLPGRTGSYLRLAYYRFTLRRVSPDAFVGFGSFFSKSGAEIGSFVSIGSYCVLGDVALGDGTVVGSRVSVPSGKRQHAKRFAAEGASEEMLFERVSIGKRCWIGEGAIVMADVGDRCIVSAGSVVTKTVESGVLVAGNPARVIRELPCSHGVTTA
jgi:acetyltransferase-like isoleucine patch superfamily enzyme